VSKPYLCENDETTKDTKAGDDDVEECAWVQRELKSVSLVSPMLRAGVLLLLRYSGQP
jgi:hypothetical protein